MEVVLKDFEITRSQAEKIAVLKDSAKHNLGLDKDDFSPFSISWDEKKTRFKEHPTVMTMPALMFRGEFVATVGFRNKSGFVLIRADIPDDLHHGILNRIHKIVEEAKRVTAILREEGRLLDDFVDKNYPKKRLGWGAQNSCVKEGRVNLAAYLGQDTVIPDGFVFKENGGSFTLRARSHAYNIERHVCAIGRNGRVIMSENRDVSGLFEIIKKAKEKYHEKVSLDNLKAEVRKVKTPARIFTPQDLQALREKLNEGPLRLSDNLFVQKNGKDITLKYQDAAICDFSVRGAEIQIEGASCVTLPGVRVNSLYPVLLKATTLIHDALGIVDKEKAIFVDDAKAGWVNSLSEALREQDFGY